jgi:hypothetical protein
VRLFFSALGSFISRGHFGKHLTGPPLSPQSDFSRHFDEVAVLGLLGVCLHRNGLVADRLCFINTHGLC